MWFIPSHRHWMICRGVPYCWISFTESLATRCWLRRRRHGPFAMLMRFMEDHGSPAPHFHFLQASTESTESTVCWICDNLSAILIQVSVAEAWAGQDKAPAILRELAATLARLHQAPWFVMAFTRGFSRTKADQDAERTFWGSTILGIMIQTIPNWLFFLDIFGMGWTNQPVVTLDSDWDDDMLRWIGLRREPCVWPLGDAGRSMASSGKLEATFDLDIREQLICLCRCESLQNMVMFDGFYHFYPGTIAGDPLFGWYEPGKNPAFMIFMSDFPEINCRLCNTGDLLRGEDVVDIHWGWHMGAAQIQSAINWQCSWDIYDELLVDLGTW